MHVTIVKHGFLLYKIFNKADGSAKNMHITFVKYIKRNSKAQKHARSHNTYKSHIFTTSLALKDLWYVKQGISLPKQNMQQKFMQKCIFKKK